MLCFVAGGTFHLVKNKSVLFFATFIPAQPVPVWGFSVLLAESDNPSHVPQR